MELKYKRLRQYADITPIHAKRFDGDAGWDLAICEDVVVDAGRTIPLSTGIAVEVPPGFFIRITNRSSTREAFGVNVNEGIVDNGWRGELIIMATNITRGPVDLLRGHRVAQMLVHKLHDFALCEVEELSPGSRGFLGFGSTGKV